MEKMERRCLPLLLEGTLIYTDRRCSEACPEPAEGLFLCYSEKNWRDLGTINNLKL